MLTKDDVYGLMVEALGEVEEMLDLYCNNSGVDPTYVLPVVRRALVATELVGETRTEHNDRQITEAFDGLRLQLAAASREEDKRCISYDRTLSLDQVRELHEAGGARIARSTSSGRFESAPPSP